MLRFAFVFALHFGGVRQPAEPGEGGDRWLAPDKVKHFVTCAVIDGTSYGVLRATGVGHQSSVIGAGVAAAAIGIGKEVRDRKAYGVFSARDLTWDLAGIGAGTALVSQVER